MPTNQEASLIKKVEKFENQQKKNKKKTEQSKNVTVKNIKN